jgi:peroxiredoxin
LGVLNVVYIARNWSTVSQVTTPRGSEAPDFTAPLLSGGRFRLADERGHPVVLAFWASWCGYCMQELPGVERVAHRLADTGHRTRLVAVNTDVERDAAARAAAQLHLTLPIALDDGSATALYRVQTIPHTVLVGVDGKVSDVRRGPQSEAELWRAIEALERR